MSARKPPGLGWESWIDRQVREATERGEFDDLAGAGQPIPDLDKPFDELWWVESINEKIRAANRNGIAGPALMLVPYDVERVIRERRHRSAA
jgi:hypothetical protein